MKLAVDGQTLQFSVEAVVRQREGVVSTVREGL